MFRSAVRGWAARAVSASRSVRPQLGRTVMGRGWRQVVAVAVPRQVRTLASFVSGTSPLLSPLSDADQHLKGPDAEVKDPHFIFRSAIASLERKYGRDKLRFPREILWLAGAPGAGKGTNTNYILRERGITADSIVVSSLLTTPEALAIKNAGGMVGDKEVVELLLEELLKEKNKHGVVVDGFPRTGIQAEVMKLLYDEMNNLRKEFFNTNIGPFFRRPTFHLVVLFVDEETAVQRQLFRGRKIAQHNARVEATGEGEMEELRATDVDEGAARHRYKVFKEVTYEPLKALRDHFQYHFIDASSTIDEVEKAITREFEYQSSLELSAETFDTLQTIPLSVDVARRGKMDLAERLESYTTEKRDVFLKVIKTIRRDFLPILRRQALTGKAVIRSESPIFHHPIAKAMALDVLSERGFTAVLDVEKNMLLRKVVMDEARMEHFEKLTYHFDITFDRPSIRGTHSPRHRF